jgi:integrase
MRLKDNPSEGKRVWLSEGELRALFAECEDDPEARIALRLMGEAGLRLKEVLRVRPADVRRMDTDGENWKLRVHEGKGNQYREAYLPRSLADAMRSHATYRGVEADEPLLGMSRRTIQRRVESAAQRRATATGDDGWTEVGCHDLRRSWGTLAVESGMNPTVVMELGGWTDWRTFREHYLGQPSDATVAAEAAKLHG